MAQCLRRVCGDEALHSQTPDSLGAAGAGCPSKGQESGAGGEIPRQGPGTWVREQDRLTSGSQVQLRSQTIWQHYGNEAGLESTQWVNLQVTANIRSCNCWASPWWWGCAWVKPGHQSTDWRLDQRDVRERQGQGSTPPWLRKAWRAGADLRCPWHIDVDGGCRWDWSGPLRFISALSTVPEYVNCDSEWIELCQTMVLYRYKTKYWHDCPYLEHNRNMVVPTWRGILRKHKRQFLN